MDFNKLRVGFWIFIFVTMSVKCLSQPLSPISPKNGLVINNDSILLRWNKMVNAISYQLKYTTDSTFISNVNTVNVGLQTTYWLTPLSSNTTYYWRVEGFNGVNTIIGIARRFTNFKPTDLAGCALWLRSDTGITLSGNNVQSWADASVNNFIATQNTAAAQPLLQSNMINGYPAVTFDGGDIFVINNFPYASVNNGFIVAKKTNAAVAHGIVISGPNFDFEMSTLRCATVYGGIIGSNFDAYKWSQIGLKRKSGDSKVFFNGLQAGAGDASSLNPVVPGNLAIGNRNPTVNSPAPLRGNVSEIVVNTSDLTNLQISTIQNYLMDKYTVELSLGNDTSIAANFCSISLMASAGFVNYQWSTGDTGMSISVNKSGIYYVEAIDVFDRVHIDSIVVSYPHVEQLNTSVLCSGSQLIWNTNLNGPYNFLWQDNSTNPFITINQAGQYYLMITDSLGCQFFSDTVNLVIDSFPDIAFIGNDTSLCTGNSIQLQVGATNATNYLWSNGSVNDSLYINSGGVFWLEVSNINNCLARDTINITLTGIAPVADFENTNVCFGLSTQFTDLTTTAPGDIIVSWEWSFGDGNFAPNQNPIHTYNGPNQYLVTLKAISQTTCAGLVNKWVTVYDHPQIDFLITNNCDSKLSSFVDASNAMGGTISSWNWDFHDSLSASNIAVGSIASHVFEQAGNYEIELVVNTQEGCVDTLFKTIDIKTSPIANFSYSKLCLGDSITFQDNSIIPFPHQNIYREWVFNDSISSSFYQPKMWYAAADSFPVKLIVMSSNGCRDTIQNKILISNLPVPEFNVNTPCIGAITSFFDNSTCSNCIVDSWKWTVGNELISVNDTAFYTFNDVGIYQVKLAIDNSQGCSSSIEKSIHILPNPIASITSEILLGSPPLTISLINNSINTSQYIWNFGDGSSSAEFEPMHVYNDTGIYTISLQAIDSNNCKSFAELIIQVLPKKIDLALLNASIEKSNNNIYTDLSFINLSSLAVHSFDIAIKNNGATNFISEKWEGKANPGEIINYRLRSSFEDRLAPNTTDFLCYTLKNIEEGADENLNNNEICIVTKIQDFKISNLFPNPGSDFIYLELISPFNGTAFIQLIDSKGALVSNQEINCTKGYNKVVTDIIQLSKGFYTCKIVFDGRSYYKNFNKIEE
jgi:PKD repeat protein